MPLDMPIHTRTLDNGLRVVVNPDHLVPLVAVEVWYDVGSRHEEPGRTGFAHLFEHVMFQGSAHVGKGEHFETVQRAGGTLNGTTSFDRTNYFETLPSHQLALGLWLEADRMGGLLDALDQENLDNQREVVKNEKRQSYDNQPYGTRYQRLVEHLFPRGHQYDHMPIGSMADLDAASLEDVQAFFRRYYAPNNAILAVVGDTEPEEAVALAERYFGGIPANPDIPPPPQDAFALLDGEVRIDVRDEVVPAERLVAAYRLPAQNSEEIEALDMAATILSAGHSSRLERRLVRRDQLAQHAGMGVERLIGGTSMGFLDVMLRSDAELGRVEAVVEEELERLAAEPPGEEEMDRARALIERTWLEGLMPVATRADALCQTAAQRADARELLAELDRQLAVTPEQVSAAVATYLRPQNRVLVAYHAGAATEERS